MQNDMIQHRIGNTETTTTDNAPGDPWQSLIHKLCQMTETERKKFIFLSEQELHLREQQKA